MQTLRARLALSFLILASSISVFGQVRATTGQATHPGQVAQQPKQEPCWKQAGISQATMEEEKSIRRESKAQIEAVCRDSSLTEQQKKAKIQEIRQAEHERLNGLISAEQREQMKQCQEARASSHPAGTHPSGAHTGPCGEIMGQ